VLSSCRGETPRALLEFISLRPLYRSPSEPGYLQLISQLAALWTSQLNTNDVGQVLALTTLEDGPVSWQLAILEGWGQGLKVKGIGPGAPAVKNALSLVRPIVADAVLRATNAGPVAERALAVRQLA